MAITNSLLWLSMTSPGEELDGYGQVLLLGGDCTRTLLTLVVTYPYPTVTKEITVLHHDLPQGFLQKLSSFSPDPAV